MRPDAILTANRTARASGAVGSRAIVPAFVRRWAEPGTTVLDFGAGPEAIHTLAMRELGLVVTAYDFGENLRPGVHDPDAMSRKYSVVLASNVLNTASRWVDVLTILDQLRDAVLPEGRVIVNLPAEPRHEAWPPIKATGDAMLRRELQRRFRTVLLMPPGFWYCRPRRT
jgi:hypothetical protein